MKPDDAERFAFAWTQIAECYGKEPQSERVLSMMYRALERYDLDQIQRALAAHYADPAVGSYMPKPADVVRRIEGTPDDQAAMAWAAVRRAITTSGGYHSVDFGDCRTHAAIMALGGWTALCNVDVDDLPYRAREFSQHYRLANPARAPKQLAGRAEISALAHGRSPPPPRRLTASGDPCHTDPTPAHRHLPAPPEGTPEVRDPRAAIRAVLQLIQSDERGERGS